MPTGGRSGKLATLPWLHLGARLPVPVRPIDVNRASHRVLRAGLGLSAARTRDLERTVAYWEAETRRFGSSAFREDEPLMRARLKTALALLRLLAAQGAQALQAQQQSGDARD